MLFVRRFDDDHLVIKPGNGVVVGGCADGLSDQKSLGQYGHGMLATSVELAALV